MIWSPSSIARGPLMEWQKTNEVAIPGMMVMVARSPSILTGAHSKDSPNLPHEVDSPIGMLYMNGLSRL
jgi:hypothetical protein